MLAPIALAQGVGVSVSANAQVGRASTTVSGNVKAEQGSTTAAKRGDNATSTGAEMRIENQSEVAIRVQALLRAADRDGGIGAEVRVIAHEYASSSARIDAAQEAVDNRPGWLTFLNGTVYGNLGALRSELVTTQNQIQRLTSAMNRSTDVSVKAELQVQIDVLEAQASTTAEFVSDNEGSFSLFGWFFRLF